MTPSRRQFFASIAAAPFLPHAALAQSRVPARSIDPVLDQIVADLRGLSSEFDTQPRNRKSTLRALEATLSVAAAHVGAYYDAGLLTSLRRRQARAGRAALAEEFALRAHDNRQHDVSADTVASAMTRLEERGLSGCFRDVQETVRRIRVQAPEQVQAVSLSSAQWDYCSDLNWQIQMLEGIVSIVCAIAILEPGPGGEAACGALMLMIGILQSARYWLC